MIAFELVQARGGHVPDPDATRALRARALANGLVLLDCGVYRNVLRILVPLTASDEVIDKGMGILEKSMVEVAQQLGASARMPT